jgi:2Fe-2S ferredoxin
MAGELIARGMVDADQTWRLFAPYELVWAGGRLGRTLVQTAYWTREGVAGARQALARQREQRRQRKLARADDAKTSHSPTA